MAVDGDRVPAAGLEARDLIVGNGKIRRPVDRDRIVVEQHDQLGEAQMARQRDRLVADAFHQAAVAGDHVGVVVDHGVAVACGHHALGKRHAHGIGQTLAERAGRRLDAGRVAELGMAGGLRTQLAEALDLAHRHVGVAGQMQQRIEQHRAVAGGQHEAVAVGPVGGRRIELQVLAPQHRGHVGHAHRHARMAGFRLLDRVHRKRPDGVCQTRMRRGLPVGEGDRCGCRNGLGCGAHPAHFSGCRGPENARNMPPGGCPVNPARTGHTTWTLSRLESRP
jgi:hypothetical protein